MKPLASSDTAKGALAGDRAARGKRLRFAVIAILSALPLSILAGEAWSESRLDILKLETSVRTLGRRVQALERLHRSVICGRMDFDLLKDSTSLYPLACQPDRDKPPLQVDLPRLRATLMRSGVFRFEFEPPRAQRPLVLATPLKGWGSVPVEMGTLRVADVSNAGFTVETFDASSANLSNVSFFFVVLAEPPPRTD
jgi:hypothetical protein